MKKKVTRELIKRQCVQGLEHCCFIFNSFVKDRHPFFRVYGEKDAQGRMPFVDYEIEGSVTPFVSFKYPDDVELMEYRLADGTIEHVMAWPHSILFPRQYPELSPGDVWVKKESNEDAKTAKTMNEAMLRARASLGKTPTKKKNRKKKS